MEKLIRHAEKQGFRVYMGTESVVKFKRTYPTNKPSAIEIREHKNEDHQLYDLLHELGHYMIRKDWKSYQEAYPLTTRAEFWHHTRGIYKYKRRIGYKIESLREEYEAWDVGLKLARKKRIDIDVQDYRKYANSMLANYVRYYGESLTR